MDKLRKKIRDALMEAQGWIVEVFGWLFLGWHLTADWLSAHRNTNLLILIALMMFAVKF
jgi:hypothetical protein